MKLQLPLLDDVIFWNLFFGLLIAFLLNYSLVYFNVIQEINLIAIAIVGVAFVYFKVEKFIGIIFQIIMDWIGKVF